MKNYIFKESPTFSAVVTVILILTFWIFMNLLYPYSQEEKEYFAIIGIIFGVFCLLIGLYFYNKSQIMELTPRSKIRSLAMGLVEVNGFVLPGKMIIKTPMTHSNCVYFKYVIEEYINLDLTGELGVWKPVKEGEFSTPFYLNDDTGKILINPKGAEVTTTSTITQLKDYNITEVVESFFSKINYNYKNVFGKIKKARIREVILEPDSRIYVLGTAVYNKKKKELEIKKGKYEKSLIISDKLEATMYKRIKNWINILLYSGMTLIFLSTIQSVLINYII